MRVSNSTQHIHIATMLSIIDLPPKIRMAIYRFLLPLTVSKTKRVLYSGKDHVRSGNTSRLVRHKQSFPATNETRRIYAHHLGQTMYHHADIDGLLLLANVVCLGRIFWLLLGQMPMSGFNLQSSTATCAISSTTECRAIVVG
jgi:hypothetical protein